MYFSCPSTKDYIVIKLAYFDVQRSYCEDQRVLNASLCFVGRFDCKMMFNGIYSVQGYGSSKLSIRFEVRSFRKKVKMKSYYNSIPSYCLCLVIIFNDK